jgi:N-acetylglucosamine-6-phosphate deacetylase
MESALIGSVTGLHYITRTPIRLNWQNGRIVQIQADDTAPADTWIAPGLIDVQINGFAGVDFQQDELSLEDLVKAVRGLRLAGCTRFLLTLITDEWAKVMSRLRHLSKLRAQSGELRGAILGWHIEGPFLSSELGFHGAHNPAWMMDPSPKYIDELRAAAGEDVLLLTLAPERPRAVETIRAAVSCGIRVSLGHTDAPAEVLRQAVEAGATGFTHLANGCPRKLDRHDNIIWRVVETHGLKVSLIPDQIHVSSALFRVLHRLLERDSIYYTTDAMSAAGASPGRYRLGSLELEVGPDQIVRQPGSELFAGSALAPIDGVFRAARMLDCPWQEIWRRFSEIPGRFIGLNHELAVGNRAEFCLIKIGNPNQLVDLKVVTQ